MIKFVFCNICYTHYLFLEVHNFSEKKNSLHIKNEKNQIYKIFQQGIIRPSTSSRSSSIWIVPVIDYQKVMTKLLMKNILFRKLVNFLTNLAQQIIVSPLISH